MTDATLADFEQRGREHGVEFAQIALEAIHQGLTSKVFVSFMVHRVASMGDELRHMGCAESEVKAWEAACWRAYHAEMAAMTAVVELSTRAYDTATAELRELQERALAAAEPHGTA